MSGIVCAVRGGPASQFTMSRAIALAKETRLRLHFLYVVNLDFFSHSSSSRAQTISQELRQMGEFILITAQSRAASQGVFADGSIHEGNVTEEIMKLCREINTKYVVMGQPRARKDNVFTREKLTCFIEEIEEQIGTQVVLVGNEIE